MFSSPESESSHAAQVPTHLAYVEWFNPIPTMPDNNEQMRDKGSV
jgi:hypothetical protein